MQRERTIRRYVPEHKERLVPQTVMTKEPIADDYRVITPSSTSYSTVPYEVARPSYDGETTVRVGEWEIVSPTSTTISKPEVAADVAPTLKGQAGENISADKIEAEADPFEDAFKAKKGTKPLSDDE
jgi:hypothetical protein